MNPYCLGIDPGLRNFAAVLVEGTRDLPMLIETWMVALDPEEPAADAYDFMVERLRLSRDAHLIIGVETFRHRGWINRRIDSAVAMGSVITAVALAARAGDVPMYLVEPAVHRESIPRALMPKALKNQHLRDAYTVAHAALGEHALKERASR